MDKYESLSHTARECKHHVVFGCNRKCWWNRGVKVKLAEEVGNEAEILGEH